MTTTNPRRQCERLWAANKYLVLSHSNKIYLEIRNYLKNDEVSLNQVQAYIDQALDLPENPGQVVNAFQHIWGRDTLHLGLDRGEILLGAGEETRLLVLLGLRSLLVLLGNGLLGLNLGVGGSVVGRCRLLSLLLVLLVGHLGYLRAMRLYMSKP